MTNPYTSPEGIASSRTENRNTSRISIALTVGCAIAIVLLGILAVVLIVQAFRLTAEVSSLPPRFQGADGQMIRASWIGGIGALIGALLNAVGLLLSRKGRISASVAILLSTIVCMIGVAIVYKPS